jgi:hypothetical protein
LLGAMPLLDVNQRQERPVAVDVVNGRVST